MVVLVESPPQQPRVLTQQPWWSYNPPRHPTLRMLITMVNTYSSTSLLRLLEFGIYLVGTSEAASLDVAALMVLQHPVAPYADYYGNPSLSTARPSYQSFRFFSFTLYQLASTYPLSLPVCLSLKIIHSIEVNIMLSKSSFVNKIPKICSQRKHEK